MLLALRCSQYGTSGALEHFPAFLLTELASVPAWQFAAGYAQLHGFALPHGAETARRCVKHSLLERPGPQGLSPLQAQGLFGSRMGRFSTFCVSKVENKSLSLSLSLSLLSLGLSLPCIVCANCAIAGELSACRSRNRVEHEAAVEDPDLECCRIEASSLNARQESASQTFACNTCASMSFQQHTGQC